MAVALSSGKTSGTGTYVKKSSTTKTSGSTTKTSGASSKSGGSSGSAAAKPKLSKGTGITIGGRDIRNRGLFGR